MMKRLVVILGFAFPLSAVLMPAERAEAGVFHRWYCRTFLVSHNGPMEKLAALRGEGRHDEAGALLDEVTAALARGAVVGMESIHPNFPEVFLVEMENGVEAVAKPNEVLRVATVREIATSRLGRLLHCPVPPLLERVVRGRSMSFQLYVAGGLTARSFYFLPPRPSAELVLFDFLTQNTDRNLGNYMLLPDGSEVWLDNDMAFDGSAAPDMGAVARALRHVGGAASMFVQRLAAVSEAEIRGALVDVDESAVAELLQRRQWILGQ